MQYTGSLQRPPCRELDHYYTNTNLFSFLFLYTSFPTDLFRGRRRTHWIIYSFIYATANTRRLIIAKLRNPASHQHYSHTTRNGRPQTHSLQRRFKGPGLPVLEVTFCIRENGRRGGGARAPPATGMGCRS